MTPLGGRLHPAACQLFGSWLSPDSAPAKQLSVTAKRPVLARVLSAQLQLMEGRQDSSLSRV